MIKPLSAGAAALLWEGEISIHINCSGSGWGALRAAKVQTYYKGVSAECPRYEALDTDAGAPGRVTVYARGA